MSLLTRGGRFLQRLNALPEKVALIQQALGRIEQRQIALQDTGIVNSEFKVFSQWGEDGIIQYLIRHVPIERKLFVEFGVENYAESNTRFLVLNNLWAGLVLDGSAENVEQIKRDSIYWSNNLKAEQTFITKDNIDDVITRNGIGGDIGLLSVDIDGNDYWVWEAITSISPRIVICEYNSLFGPVAKVTTPYDPAFVRDTAHHSKVYYGASIAALSALASKKGYSLVAGNSAGNNVFFVRNDLLGGLQVLTPVQAYRQSRFREYHDEQGGLTFYDFATRLEKLKGMPLHDLTTGTVRPLADIAGIIES
jgi:hypothetical protein